MQHLQYSKPSSNVAAAPAVPRATMMLYRDYTKSVSDLFSKNFSAPGVWKVESKCKAAPGTFVLNPQVSPAGELSTDVEYTDSTTGRNTVKINLTPAGLNNVKTTAKMQSNGHTVEVVLHKKKNDLQYELSHHTSVDAQEHLVTVNEKLTRDMLEVGVSVQVTPYIQMGFGSQYSFVPSKDADKKPDRDISCRWSVGARGVWRGCDMVVRTNHLRSYTTTASAPVCFHVGKTAVKARVALETECGRALLHGWRGLVGVDLSCPLLQGNHLYARLDRDLKWAATYAARLADNWTMAVTLTRDRRVGVHFTHN